MGGDFRTDRGLEQVHLVIGLEGLSYHDSDFYALQVFSTLLGGGMSSRLFQEVRERRGLVYTIHSFASSFADCGVFGVYAGTGAAEVMELVPVVCHELKRAAIDASEEEIARARAQLKVSTLMALESTSARCDQLAQQMLVFGRPIPISEVIAKIDAVDQSAVARVAARLVATQPTIAALGPLGGLEPYQAILARLR